MGGTDRDELARRIERGEYRVDSKEVAAAMLRRHPSMFEALEARDRPPAPVEQDEPAPGVDLA
jgi:hypothetical protein